MNHLVFERRRNTQINFLRKNIQGNSDVTCDFREETLTDVGMLEQSADPGFSLQLLMVYKTVAHFHNNVSDVKQTGER